MITSIIKLSRPVNVIITMVSVCIAALLAASASSLNWAAVLAGAFSAGIIAAAGNVHNDILDIEVDRVNRPDRPLPRGDISRVQAYYSAVAFYISGMMIGGFISISAGMITFSASAMLVLYNIKLKMTPLWGNIAVSLLTALAFIYGAVLAGNPAGGIIPAVFSLFFHFSREMVKDMEDIKGDEVRPGQTFARKFGAVSAARLAKTAIVILMLLIPIPYFAKLYNIGYLLVCLIGVELPLLWVVIRLKEPEMKSLSAVSTVLKAGMVMGLAAFFVG